MALKRIIGRHNKKYRTCLNCGKSIYKVLKDNEPYTCDRCGQKHLIDVYPDNITMTVAERPDLRYRPETEKMSKEQRARKALIAKVDSRRMEEETWEDKYRDWLEELAEMPERERKVELDLMGEELLSRVKRYLDKRNRT